MKNTVAFMVSPAFIKVKLAGDLNQITGALKYLKRFKVYDFTFEERAPNSTYISAEVWAWHLNSFMEAVKELVDNKLFSE